jgi:hypothetical protein
MLIIQVLTFTALNLVRIWQIINEWNLTATDFDVNRIEFALFILLQFVILWILWGIGVPQLKLFEQKTPGTQQTNLRQSSTLNYEEDAVILENYQK